MTAASTPSKVVIVGAGLGGLRTAEALRGNGFGGRIHLVGDETHLPYDRPPLSKQILAGKWGDERATLRGEDVLAKLDLDLHLGSAAVRVDESAVELADGSRLPFDALVVATGVRPRRLPDQPDHPRLHLLRTLDDCRALRASIQQAGSVLVIGAGFIGAEVAATARAGGAQVTVVEALPVPFEPVLGEQVGRLCAELHRDHDVELRCGTRIEAFVDSPGAGVPHGDGVAARLSDGSTVRADCAVVGVGTVLDTAWLDDLGLATDRGIACDQHGLAETTDNVYAVGDIAAWRHPTHGDRFRTEHWTSAVEQAAVVAQRIAGAEVTRPADLVPYFWSDQYGLKLQLVGRPELATEVQLLAEPTSAKGTIAGYFRDDKLVAAFAISAPKALARFRQLVGEGAGRARVHAAAAELAP